jgi:colanic acid biosynthesis glycosyl transferase WcaI
MRILFYSQWWQPEQFFKGLPFAKALVERGHQVEVLTGFPNYPSGKIFPPYRLKFFQKEIMEGVKVNRVFLYPSHNSSALKRISNYLSFMVASMLIGPFLVGRADVVYAYNLVTLAPFWTVMKWLYHSKVILDIQDLWPESILSTGMMGTRWYFKWFDKLCKWLYSRADKVIVLSPGFKEYLVAKGVPEEEIEVIYNWCDESSFPSETISQEGIAEERTLRILYAGTMGPAQGLATVVESAEICQREGMNVIMKLIGHGICYAALQEMVKSMGLRNCEILPGRPLREMGEMFRWADILLVHLKDDPLFRITIPSKTQAYLYLGKPILMAGRGDAANIVQEAQAGIVCSPENSEEIVAAIRKFLSKTQDERIAMGERGRAFYQKKMSFDTGVTAFEKIFRSLEN